MSCEIVLTVDEEKKQIIVLKNNEKRNKCYGCQGDIDTVYIDLDIYDEPRFYLDEYAYYDEDNEEDVIDDYYRIDLPTQYTGPIDIDCCSIETAIDVIQDCCDPRVSFIDNYKRCVLE